MRKHDRAVLRAVRRYCKSQRIKPLSVSHINPRAYITEATPDGLMVAFPEVDAEPRLASLNMPKSHFHRAVMFFDASLGKGDWCSAAYVVTSGWGQMVAIPAVPRP